MEDSSPTSQNSIDSQRVGTFALFRFAERTDKILISIGTLTAICVGVCAPLMSIIFGSAVNGFSSDNSPDETLDEMWVQALRSVYLGIIVFFVSAITEACWTAAGERLGVKVRSLYLEAILKKDVTWFDVNSPQELPTKIASLVAKYQGGIGEKVGKVLISVAMVLAGLVVAFIYGWQLALVMIAISPLAILSARLIDIANSRGMETSKKAYATCGGYAEEALSAIRTVYAFCAECYEKNKYLKELGTAESAAVKNSVYIGAAIGLVNFTMSLLHGLGYLIGSFLIQYNVYSPGFGEDYSSGAIITVFFSGFFAMISLGMLAPQLKSISEARVAAFDIYKIIDSTMGSLKEVKVHKRERIPPETFKGCIEFHNVTFCYPTRPDIRVLDNFSFTFENGKMAGICGETGSGKSTIIQLIERFYTPNSGKITVDGIDLNDLDLEWWHQQVGYVGQEPVLFNTSIKANIEYGKEGASLEEIEEAAVQANANEFIEKLQGGYEAITGAEGGQLSGGQKQRIAIARALVKQPKVLLLDEATSALDGKSERKVQEAFYKLREIKGLTVISIAHRLATIKNSDKIIVLQDGVLKEQGTDAELRGKNTIYANLCKLQNDNGGEVEILDNFQARKQSVHEVNLDKPKDAPAIVEEHVDDKVKEEKAGRYKSELWKENWKYTCPLVSAIVLSVIAGMYMPVTGMLFGWTTMDLLEPDESELRRKVNLDFVGFLCSGVGMFCATLGSFWLFGYVASKITHTLRERLYEHIMRMDVGWFDLPANLPSNLNGVLAEATDNINDVVKMIAGTMIQCVSALLIALGLAFYFSWKMALVVLACVPIIGASAFLQTKFEVGFARQSEELYKESMKILSEAVKNIRTVASFSNESRILKMYNVSLNAPLSSSQRASIISGILFGLGEMLPYFLYPTLYYFTALFLLKYGDDPRKTFAAMYSLFFAAAAIGQLQQYAPDMGKAYASLFSVFGILDQIPTITSKENASQPQIEGNIEFKNVFFKYPTRSDYVLRDLSLKIEAGQKVAIVGISGSGKSTIVSLLERFYDVTSGQILIDNIDIKDYDLTTLRQALGYVPQEPILFDTTIEGNVKYGNEKITREDVESACEVADATDFIGKRNEGYMRRVGAKGSLLSGGQKQRLAIARAVLKKPKIMLFDEATSALDSETEKQVQKALEQVSQGRTSIVIAHRLGTIGEGDRIFVLENGKVVEQGTKKELVEKKGSFYKLYGSNAAKVEQVNNNA